MRGIAKIPVPVSIEPSTEAFLREIGYLVTEKEPFAVSTANVDEEIAHIAGPQLVVPVSNARYALNAANARWGSFTTRFTAPTRYRRTVHRAADHTTRNAARRVIDFVRGFLDEHFPLVEGSHRDAVSYHVETRAHGPIAEWQVDALELPAAFSGFKETPLADRAVAGAPRPARGIAH